MARRPNPLVPLDLFRQRAFATINLATFFIYGALYVTISYQALVFQNTLGYTALAAGAIGVPTGILLSVLSTRVGTLAGRLGARRFLVAGPLLMAVAMLWYARLPADSEAWKAAFETPASLIPPLDTWIDVVPAVLVFGVGHLARRGAADEHPDGLAAEPVLGSRLGDQQLHLAGRSAAPRRDHLRGDQRDVLCQPRVPVARASTPPTPPFAASSSRSTRRPPGTSPTRWRRRRRHRWTPSTWRRSWPPPSSSSGRSCRGSGCATRNTTEAG